MKTINKRKAEIRGSSSVRSPPSNRRTTGPSASTSKM